MARGYKVVRWLLSAVVPLCFCGCPNQELVPLLPCTVSIVSLDAKQTGTDQVDLLFVIDNSGSMSEEQVKLNAKLPGLVKALTTGDFDGVPNADGKTDFQPVGSLRLGVVSSDLGANGVRGLKSCGSNSFSPTEQDTGTGADNVDRPFGDDGQLFNSTAVAVAGVSIQVNEDPVVAINPRPECAGLNLPRFLEFPGGGSAADIAAKFSCVAELGVTGCGIEQQLESMWKALAPSSDRSFSRGTGGQGAPAGVNNGFVRPDAILAVILVTDEEDCSSPDASAPVLYSQADQNALNVLCGRNPDKLHQAQRYIAGLKSLKSEAYQDRVIFAGIVGVPLAVNTRGLTLDQILARSDMQFAEEAQVGSRLRPRPVCIASQQAGDAAPARRIVEVAKGFGENGVITSICEDDYGAALDAVLTKIAAKLNGQCLPRSLNRNARGIVECRVVEIKRPGDRSGCDAGRGRIAQLPDRDGRVVCEVAQLAVVGRTEPSGVGWYYDDFSAELESCTNGRQRIAFAASSPLDDGAGAFIECYRSVAEPTPNALGVAAINTSCTPEPGGGLSGNEKCAALSQPDAALVCVNGTCQVSCTSDAQCPPGRVCTAAGGLPGFCENPTCPTAISDS